MVRTLGLCIIAALVLSSERVFAASPDCGEGAGTQPCSTPTATSNESLPTTDCKSLREKQDQGRIINEEERIDLIKCIKNEAVPIERGPYYPFLDWFITNPGVPVWQELPPKEEGASEVKDTQS